MKDPLLLAQHGVTIVASIIAIVSLIRWQLDTAGIWACASLLSSIRSDLDWRMSEILKLIRNIR